jgi:hypothetical protein
MQYNVTLEEITMGADRRVTTQDVSWFIDLYKNNQLDLNPSYQRRSVWSLKDRRFFLDTIFRNYPSPSIFLHKRINEEGNTIYDVVDGKQRLETILDFIEDKIAIDKKFGDIRLDGMKWKNVKDNQELTRMLWDYVIPVEFINVVKGSYVNEVFDRLNRSARKLVEQELRHAQFDGWFITLVDQESEDPDWKELGIVTTSRSRRMRDVQFLSELLIVLLKSDISGFDQEEISKFYAKFESPEETVPNFDKDQTKEWFVKVRRFLLALERENKSVTSFAKDFKDFYSLWSVVALNLDKLANADQLASMYATFMEKVQCFKNDEFLTDEHKAQYSPQFRYFQNSLGANTEEPQRRERHNALKSIILDEDKK